MWEGGRRVGGGSKRMHSGRVSSSFSAKGGEWVPWRRGDKPRVVLSEGRSTRKGERWSVGSLAHWLSAVGRVNPWPPSLAEGHSRMLGRLKDIKPGSSPTQHRPHRA